MAINDRARPVIAAASDDAYSGDGGLPPVMVTGFLSFGLMALLYLVTEELLVDAHQKSDTVWISSAFFVGFLALLALEELMG